LVTPAILQPVLTKINLGKIEEIQWHGIYCGRVIFAALNFLIVALIVFFLVRAMYKAAEKAKLSAEVAAKSLEDKVKKEKD